MRLFRFISGNLPALLILSAMILISFISGIVITGDDAALNDFGGMGQGCYPNDTCDKPLTCYRIRNERQCEQEIKAVTEDGRMCYTTHGSHDDRLTEAEPVKHCFVSEAECQADMQKAIQSNSRLAQGCKW